MARTHLDHVSRNTPLFSRGLKNREYRNISFFLIVGVFCLAVPWIRTARADDEADYQRMLDDKSSALVTIKCVLKIKAGANEQEMESENTGVMIDDKGLILCSNSRLNGPVGVVMRLRGSKKGVTMTPTDLKVLIGDATEGVEAKFVARDTELDLAWIRIKDPGDKKFRYIDLSKSEPGKLGRRFFTVSRLSKDYDRVPIVSDRVINGITKKPRDLYMAGDLSDSLGLPVYTPDGKVLGVTILQVPDSEDETNAQMAMLNRMTNSHEMSGAILPAADVIKATARAKETAASQPASAEAGDSEKPEPEEKPAKKKPAAKPKQEDN